QCQALVRLGVRRVAADDAAGNRVLFDRFDRAVVVRAPAVAQGDRFARAQPQHAAGMVRILAPEKQHAVFRLSLHKESWHMKIMNLSYSSKKTSVLQVNNP